MQSSNAPTKIQIPFAQSGTKNAIPTEASPSTSGAASFPTGFPPLTMTPLAAGGIPPAGADFNGILYAITAIQQWQSAGGGFVYDSAYATAIGGYPKGALLMSADLSHLWLNTTDNNTTNPDSDGTGWINPGAGRLLNIQVFETPGTFTYTKTPGTNSVVVEVQGGGAGSGGVAATASGQLACSGAGGAGAYAKSRYTSGFDGVSITVGAGGAGGAAGANSGSPGGTSSFGTLVSAPGGSPGGSLAPTTTAPNQRGGSLNSSEPAGGNIVQTAGAPGNGTSMLSATSGGSLGFGASSMLGSGGAGSLGNGQIPVDGKGYGAGAGGIAQIQGSAATAGARGSSGIVVVMEYA